MLSDSALVDARKPLRLRGFFLPDFFIGSAQQGARLGSPVLRDEPKEHHMYASIRRYDGVDQSRAPELTRKVSETLVPKLSKLPGFSGYYLIEGGNGVFSALGLFETPEQSEQSTKVVSSWIQDEKFEQVLPN